MRDQVFFKLFREKKLSASLFQFLFVNLNLFGRVLPSLYFSAGPPGIGKTLATCTFARHVASTFGSPVVYIRLTKSSVRITELRTELNVLQSHFVVLLHTGLHSKNVCPKNVLLVIVDGFRSTTDSQIVVWAEAQLSHAKYRLYLTSGNYKPTLENGERCKTITLAYWEKDDYFKALALDPKLWERRAQRLDVGANPDAADAAALASASAANAAAIATPPLAPVSPSATLAAAAASPAAAAAAVALQAVAVAAATAPLAAGADSTLADLVDRQFFYAGHSARWFFNLTDEQVREEIENHISALKTTFAVSAAPASAQDLAAAKNHLVVAGGVIVSKYALIGLIEHRDQQIEDYVNQIAKSCFQNNPSARGWLFEFRVLDRVKTGQAIQLGFNRTLRADAVVLFCDLGSMRIPSGLSSAWFIPWLWNQGAYDLLHVQIFSAGDGVQPKRSKPPKITTTVITFIQITLAAQHTIKCRFLKQAIAQLCGQPTSTPMKEIVDAHGNVRLKPYPTLCGEQVQRLEVHIVGFSRKAPAVGLNLEEVGEPADFFQVSSVVDPTVGDPWLA